ncbi:MAG: signal peptidase I [Sedimentisphaerales bacterium]|nr:signal peptidase I [Sedimentisphaerales bacterium]
MAASTPPRAGNKRPVRKKKDRAAEIANTFEWLITAFILAFVFRAFVMEAFRIPTGSMADTLMGAHWQLRCPQCGYRYEFGYTSPGRSRGAEDTIPLGPRPVGQPTRCPSCGYYTPPDGQAMTIPVANGDRILVFKCIYQFTDPKRWDVIVFKNPTDPTENYIKRLIGLPGETVEIVDGDIYINGQIARKPAQVQKELWMPVYDNDFRPVNPNLQGAFNGHTWRPPFDFGASAWKIDEQNPTRLILDRPADEINTLTYGAPSANDFTVAYAYNELGLLSRAHDCNDLMMRFYVRPQDREGQIGISLTSHGVEYQASVRLSGTMTLAKVEGNKPTEFLAMSIKPPAPGEYTLMKFAVVDRQLLFAFGDAEMKKDLGGARPTDAPQPAPKIPPGGAIFGSGKLTLSHVALFRDIYYTDGSENPVTSAERAIEGKPFTLNADEFFALGDNSPNSSDGRYWHQPAPATKGTEPPRAGVVPRYYLVGKALFVYWPSGFEFPWPAALKMGLLSHVEANQRNAPLRLLYTLVSLRWIPNFGQMRFIYGGENGQDQETVD